MSEKEIYNVSSLKGSALGFLYKNLNQQLSNAHPQTRECIKKQVAISELKSRFFTTLGVGISIVLGAELLSLDAKLDLTALSETLVILVAYFQRNNILGALKFIASLPKEVILLLESCVCKCIRNCEYKDKFKSLILLIDQLENFLESNLDDDLEKTLQYTKQLKWQIISSVLSKPMNSNEIDSLTYLISCVDKILNDFQIQTPSNP